MLSFSIVVTPKLAILSFTIKCFKANSCVMKQIVAKILMAKITIYLCLFILSSKKYKKDIYIYCHHYYLTLFWKFGVKQ